MELKKIFLVIILIFSSQTIKAEMVKPAENLTAYDVIKIQLEALKKK